ncbi:E3 SUMO-protein ligase KIAA1586-like [Acyrthosiphon pisum]|uniref:HAT C-terminal dimerisation domain-containing protein n=1 Tax=Acyrthosiphon pisum TaxID=7029 RepID=A0A8R2B5T8_ACYPI|nr:E3 SUMO-protein ligase KIAA1586-like [Acyrthosiphon pisum]XP_008188619.1 E3 SUMO-protein ligase KIAA1586-like [Acyrthosiphon pisum]|eukprot:XP_008183248.1 PREDICTED: E3 SUMO-protein ligase KIAA1586-like [Acyrthosiphon pisum]
MVWNESQWIEFKEKYPWIVSADGKLGCNICSSITCLGASKKDRLRISNEWSNGLIEASGKDRTSQLSNLRIKIKKHYESERHQLADKINKERKEKSIQVSMQKSIVDHEQTTIKVFRTAYYIAMKNRPFSDHDDLIKLQEINGVNLGGNNPEYVFLDLCELQSQDAEQIEKQLLNTLKSNGVVTRLREKYPKLFTWHCFNHRLELSVSDTIKDVRGIDHFKCFIDKLYSLYNQSPKHSRALESCCQDLKLQFNKIGRVLSTRWVSSSLRTVRAVWKSFAALHSHFKNSCDDQSNDKNTIAVFIGLKKRLESPEFILGLGIMYDVLQELSMLSNELQSRTITLPKAEQSIKRTIRIIESFKQEPGEYTQIALNAKSKLLFNEIELVPNKKIVAINQNQFIQSIVDRMTTRLCSRSEDENYQLLSDISALDLNNIKIGSSGSIRYGELELRRICRRFDVDEVQAVQGLRAFIENNELIPDNFKPILNTIASLPCSTAECERGFSLMNNIITNLRASLLISNVSSLMFIKSNGPPIEVFNPEMYVRSWLEDHRSADDNQSRLKRNNLTKSESRQHLWDIFQ